VSDSTQRRSSRTTEKSSAPPAPSWESTAHLVDRARVGDRSAVNVLLERALPTLRRWTRGRIPAYTRGHADTEDVVQDAIVQTLKRIDTFDHRNVGALQAFLREVVINRIRDIVRMVQRRGVPEDLPEHLVETELSPLEQAIMQQRTEHFVAALQQLKPTDREVIVWRIELGYSYQEIASRLGKTTEAARMKVSRAVDRLAKLLVVEPPTAASSRTKTTGRRR
jgi:RNA polymerase sigma factor (sigma-70 family)